MNKNTTNLYIIGSLHYEDSELFNYHKLVDVLEKIMPALILEEKDLDWELYDENFHYKTELFDDPSYCPTNESKAICEYSQKQIVKQRPIDMKSFGEWCRSNKYPEKMDILDVFIDDVYNDKTKFPEKRDVIVKWIDAENNLESIKGIEDINSLMYEDAARNCENMINKEILPVFESDSELIKYCDSVKLMIDIWIKRNDSMVENSLKWINELKPRKAVIIVGARHVYYLKDCLKKVQNMHSFELKAINGLLKQDK